MNGDEIEINANIVK